MEEACYFLRWDITSSSMMLKVFFFLLMFVSSRIMFSTTNIKVICLKKDRFCANAGNSESLNCVEIET